jgi:hypothetical protein
MVDISHGFDATGQRDMGIRLSVEEPSTPAYIPTTTPPAVGF